jgi:hypothetical protein
VSLTTRERAARRVHATGFAHAFTAARDPENANVMTAPFHSEKSGGRPFSRRAR